MLLLLLLLLLLLCQSLGTYVAGTGSVAAGIIYTDCMIDLALQASAVVLPCGRGVRVETLLVVGFRQRCYRVA